MMDIEKVVNKISLLHSTSVETPTSFKLAYEIVDFIKIDWKRKDLKILDPSCGRGTFLLAVLKKLIENGHSVQDASRMIYGCDTSRLQTKIASKALTLATGCDNNIYCEDSLEKEWNMKFDVVVGNPPFQQSKKNGKRKDQASNLWSKFWSKSFSITTNNGIIAFITPTTWTSPSGDLKGKFRIGKTTRLWDVFSRYTSYANIVDVAKHFPGVGSSFGYVIVDKSSSHGLVFSDNSDISLGFLPKNNIDDVKKQLSKTNNLGNNFKIDQGNKPTLRVSIPMSKALKEDRIEILNGKTNPTKGSPKPGLYLYVYVPTQADAEKVKARIIDCIDILSKECRWSGFLSIQAVKMIEWR
jgi:tRNA1(Val) A37 N6-methylase TrmN6